MQKRKLRIPAVIVAIVLVLLIVFGLFMLVERIMPSPEGTTATENASSEATSGTEQPGETSQTEQPGDETSQTEQSGTETSQTEHPGDETSQTEQSGTETSQTEQSNTETSQTEPDIPVEPIYVKRDIVTYLFIGVDENDLSQSSIYGKGAMADSIVLLVVDKTSGKYSLIQFDRDTMVEVDVLGIGGRKIRTVTEQLSYAHMYGDENDMRCRNTEKSVSRLIDGISIDHYLSMTMDAVAVLADYVGGVTVTLDRNQDLTSINPLWKPGATITLRGNDALSFVRSREGVEDETNISRMRRGRQFMEAFMKKVMPEMTYSFVEGAYNAVLSYTVTDMNNNVNNLDEFFRYVSEYDYNGIYVPEGRSVVGESLMEFYIDEVKMRKLIYDIFYEKRNG